MIKNANQLPKVLYGLHFCEGVAEYREPGKDPYRILINESTIRKMGPTFSGRPVYVKHVDEVSLDNIQIEADGYVVESFLNSSDGKHWVKFIVVSDKGHEAIRKGWKLSNAYVPKTFADGGLWHGVEYQKEVMSGEYEHLAIVPNPRYAESIILDAEQFKQYNTEKELELKRLANSKEEPKGEDRMLFFKRTKVENSADFESMSVTLPLSKKERTLSQVVNELDAIYNMNGYANGDHYVKAGEEEMTVNDMVAKYSEMKKNLDANKEKEGDLQEDKKSNEESEEEKKAAADKKKNEEEAAAKGKEDEKKQNSLHFDTLKNAPNKALAGLKKIDLGTDKASRGKTRYGSK
jgi:hypothetical protein